MKEPRFIKEGLDFFDEETQQWKLKPDTPQWAREEFEEFFKMVNPKPDEHGIVTQY